MKTYQYRSAGTGAMISLTYFEGLLQSVEFEAYEADPSTNARAPFYLSEVQFLKSCQDFKVQYVELTKEISFDMFWDRYAYKADKALAIEAWNKLPREEQVRAYMYIPRYNVERGNLGKKYAVRYLKHKPWVK